MEPKEEKKHLFPKFSKKTKSIFVVTFFVGVVFLFATYAWFSASLNVKIKFFNIKVSTDTGLFISLDGVNFSDSIEVSRQSLIYDVTKLYPNHTNQWSNNGLWSVSTNGIASPNNDKFAVYSGSMGKYTDRARRGKRFVNTTLLNEDKPSEYSNYIAFDIFLKNVSGSPHKDNLYIGPGTYIEFDEEADAETREKMEDIMNSIRLGFVKIGETHLKADPATIQNLKCNNECFSLIYEPNSLKHNEESIEAAKNFGINLVDNTYVPTYGVVKEGKFLDHKSGLITSQGVYDTEHFALQETRQDDQMGEPMFQIPNGITKVRVYLWIEGQDIDALEVHSEGAPLNLSLDLEKDLAGYEL